MEALERIESDMKKKRVIGSGLIGILLILAAVCLIQNGFARLDSPTEVVSGQLGRLLSGEGQEETEEELAATFISALQEKQFACALESSEPYQKDFYERAKSGLSHINYQVSENSRGKTEAEVTVTIQCFNTQEMPGKVQKRLETEFPESYALSVDQRMELFYKVLAETFQNGPEAGDETRMTVYLQKERDGWKIKGNFAQAVFRAILQ